MNIHALSGIHTRDPSNQAAADLAINRRTSGIGLCSMYSIKYLLDTTYKPCKCATAAVGRLFCDGATHLLIKTRPSLAYFFSCWTQTKSNRL